MTLDVVVVKGTETVVVFVVRHPSGHTSVLVIVMTESDSGEPVLTVIVEYQILVTGTKE